MKNIYVCRYELFTYCIKLPLTWVLVFDFLCLNQMEKLSLGMGVPTDHYHAHFNEEHLIGHCRENWRESLEEEAEV